MICILLTIFGFCSGMAIILLAWWLDDPSGQIDGEESDDDWNCDDKL